MTEACESCAHSELDCNDADPNVHPGAQEKYGDGIDNNCDGAACGTIHR